MKNAQINRSCPIYLLYMPIVRAWALLQSGNFKLAASARSSSRPDLRGSKRCVLQHNAIEASVGSGHCSLGQLTACSVPCLQFACTPAWHQHTWLCHQLADYRQQLCHTAIPCHMACWGLWPAGHSSNSLQLQKLLQPEG